MHPVGYLKRRWRFSTCRWRQWLFVRFNTPPLVPAYRGAGVLGGAVFRPAEERPGSPAEDGRLEKKQSVRACIRRPARRDGMRVIPRKCPLSAVALILGGTIYHTHF